MGEAGARRFRWSGLPRVLLTQSLKARVTLFTLFIGIISTVFSGLYVSYLLRVEVEEVLAAQQFATSRSLAEGIERQLQERVTALEHVALMAGLHTGPHPNHMQQMLQDLPVFQDLFNGGTFLMDTQGVAIASMPVSAQRIGVSYADRDYFAQAVATGRPVIGAPTIGRALRVPVVVMSAPVRDAMGRVTGVLAGVINLQEASFLDSVQTNSFGKTGSFLLVAPQHRVVITSSDRERVMERMLPPGANAQIDRFVAGFEGTTILRNPQGIEVISSVKRVPAAGWYVAVTLPTAEAFAPVIDLERRLFIVTTVLSLLAGVLVWWVLRRELTPLQAAAQTLSSLSSRDVAAAPVELLQVDRPDEIGQLIQSFNHLLDTLNQQRSKLEQSELLYSTAFRTSPDAITITRLDNGGFLAVNESFTRMFGWRSDELVGRTAADIGIWRRPADRAGMMQQLDARGRFEAVETEMISREGRVLSVQMSASRMQMQGVDCLLSVVHDITARRQAQQQIETLAFRDVLTGLPNRRMFMDRLVQVAADASRRGQFGALLFIDLDDFKVLNDSLGHDQGDHLLRELARRLESAVQAGDTVARLGGDEFVALIPDLGTQADSALAKAQEIAQALQQQIAQRTHLADTHYQGSASVGLALFGQSPDDSALDLLKRAELAMYHAKALGRGQVAAFSPEMQTSLTSRARLEADLRLALEEHQLELHYQPQVDTSGRIVSVEALLRWRHPQRGMVSPGEFIPAAEHSGLIVPIGHWVLRSACERLAAWSREPALAGLCISVNVSSLQFRQNDFVERVLDLLDETGAKPQLLMLELTESLLVDNIEEVTTRMARLKARGVAFSLDDFGTGFSSLIYLKRLPLDELKIDQGFVRDIEVDDNDLAIARTVIALGHSLGLRVLAEGVESPAQRETLGRLGCRHYQGYLFGRPMPAPQLEALVRDQAAASPVKAASQRANASA